MKRLLLPLIILLLAACGDASTTLTETASLEATLTPRPSATSIPTDTPPPPTATATPQPLAGTTTAQVNVRTGPGQGYNSVGLVDPGGEVLVTGVDESGEWYQVLFEAGPSGKGWAAAAYITVENTGSLPVVTFGPASATPGGVSGQLTARVNVRAGPGTVYDSLGRLEAGTTVIPTGRNATTSWVQIEYAGSETGRGWVSAAYVQFDDFASLPVLDPSGNPVTPEPAGGTPVARSTPSPTVGPAYNDGDSPTNPLVRVAFSTTGTRRFIYTGDVSAPEGDPEDWLEFTPAVTIPGGDARLLLSLACQGNGALVTALSQGGLPLTGWGTLDCGTSGLVLDLPSGQAYRLQVRLAEAAGLRLVRYTLTVRQLP
ncbi:MAG: SH3 domain-containing protein [Chloroflexota bacterium]